MLGGGEELEGLSKVLCLSLNLPVFASHKSSPAKLEGYLLYRAESMFFIQTENCGPIDGLLTHLFHKKYYFYGQLRAKPSKALVSVEQSNSSEKSGVVAGGEYLSIL